MGGLQWIRAATTSLQTNRTSGCQNVLLSPQGLAAPWWLTRQPYRALDLEHEPSCTGTCSLNGGDPRAGELFKVGGVHAQFSNCLPKWFIASLMRSGPWQSLSPFL